MSYEDTAVDMAADQPSNPYAAAAADMAGEQRTAVRTAATIGAASSPDQAAVDLRLSRQTGLPPDMVGRNRPAVQQRATVETIDANTAAAPTLRNRYADPSFAAVAHDDSGRLAHVEQQVGAYTAGSALRKGAASLKLTLDFLADQLAGAVGADRTETRRILASTSDYYRQQGSDPELAAATEAASKAGGGTWYGALLHLPGAIGEAEHPFATVGRFLTEQLPGALVGFGIGAAATAPARSAITSRIASELVRQGVDKGLAGAAGGATATVVASMGANYEEGLSQGLPPEDAATRAWKKTAAEVPANAIAGAALGLKIGPNALTNLLGQSTIQGAGGAISTVQGAQAVGEEADPGAVALSALGGAISAGPELAGLALSRITGSKAAARAEQAHAATAGAEQVGALIQAADASALKERDAPTFHDFVRETAPDAVVYVDPQHLAAVDLSATPELARQAAEAQASGGMVAVPMSDLLAHLPGEELLPNLRTTPDGMTLAEARGFDGPAELAKEMAAPEAPAVGDAPAEPPTLIRTPEQAHMTPEAWTEYQQHAAEAADAAAALRDSRNLKDMQWLANRKDEAMRAVAREARDVRADIEQQARAEVQARPEFAAKRHLRTPEGKAAHPDAVAEAFGFATADDMRQAIKAAGKEADAVDALTDQRLADQRPDLIDRIHQERAAEAWIADRARERFLATEAAALKAAVGNRTILGAQTRAYAEGSIARRTVREARPAQFRASAERAARSAEEAFARGETSLAAKFKQTEALQTALQNEARATVDEVNRAVAQFKRIASTREDAGRDANLAATARAILAQYGLAGSGKPAAEYLGMVQRYDPELHADLLVLMEGLPAAVADHRDLSVADFRTLRDRVAALWTLARSTRTIEIDGQRVDIAEAAGAMAAQLANEKQRTAEQQVGRNERLDLRMRLAGMRAALRRVEFWADARDRGDSAGVFRKYMWQPVSEAVTRYRTLKNEKIGAFYSLLQGIEKTLDPGKIAAPELADGVVFADRSALLHALLHTGNESNRRKLLLGYRWATEHEDGSLDTSRWDAFLARMHAEKRITKADWDFAQATWDLTDSMKPGAQRAHEAMFGHYFDEVTAQPVQTPFGEYRGGYVPAMTDTLLVTEGRQHGTMDDMLASQNSPMFPSVGRGFTKSRVEDYTKPLALDLRLIPAHLDKVARFTELGPTLRDTARLIVRNREFRTAMDAVDPTAVEAMLVPWLKRTASQTLNKAPETMADRGIARIANTLRTRTGLLTMMGNVTNTLQQVTGLTVAALRVSPRHLAGGFYELIRNPSSTIRAIDELSPWMKQRTDDSARHTEQAMNDLVLNPSMRQRAENAGLKYGYALQQGFQNVMDRAIWMGAYRQAEHEGKPGVDSVREADAAVRMTQSSFAPEDASRVEHAHAFTRLFLQFASFFNGQANLLATEAVNAKGSAGRLATVYLLGFAIPAVLADVIGKGVRGELISDDEDGDELAAKLAQTFFLSQARYALAGIPVAGQVGNAALGQFTPERFDDKIGASPAISQLESAIRAPRSIYRAVAEDGNPKAAVRDGLTAAGLLTGLPVGVLVRPAGYLADENREGITLRGLVTGNDASTKPPR